MTAAMWTPDDQAASLRTVAIWGYVDSEIRVPIDPAAFPGYAAALQTSRLIGPLLAAAAVGEVDVPDVLRADLIERQQAALAWCIQLEVRLLEIREWFDDAGGIEHRVIKGPAIAHLDALEPSLRTFADVDLLIAADDIDQAVRILMERGATRPWAERRPGFDRRFAKSVTITCADGVEVDVHRTLADGVFGHRIPLDDLFRRSDSFDIGGITFRALDPTDRMLHTAYHLLLGSPEPKLMSLRDMVGYLHGDTAAGGLSETLLGVDVVTERARQWGGEAVLAMSIDQVGQHLGAQMPEPWSRWRADYRLNEADRTLIERHRGEGSSFGPAKFDLVRDLEGVRTRLAYLMAVAWPSRDHLESRGLNRRDMIRSWARIR